jgi:hypothetical protein
MAVDDGLTRSRHDVQPLVGAAVAILAVSLRFAGRQHHFGSLRTPVGQND